MTPMGAAAPIGVFDSGVGGLSVLRHIRAALPGEDLLYFADSANAPYGDKSEQEIVTRSMAIADFLMQYRAKAIVVACNTATAAAIKGVRARYPELPVVGVEPGLKPAAALTRSGTVGVLATSRTLSSEKFGALREQIAAATGVRFLPQACVGLVDQIEKGELQSAATIALLQRYLEPLLAEGADTLVLGCTHYPFVLPLIEELASRLSGQPVTVVDTGAPIARHLVRLLTERNLLGSATPAGTVTSFTTGSETALAGAFSKLLDMQPTIVRLSG
jgi:glutamate racemase